MKFNKEKKIHLFVFHLEEHISDDFLSKKLSVILFFCFIINLIERKRFLDN